MTRKKLYQPIEKRLHLKPVHLKKRNIYHDFTPYPNFNST